MCVQIKKTAQQGRLLGRGESRCGVGPAAIGGAAVETGGGTVQTEDNAAVGREQGVGTLVNVPGGYNPGEIREAIASTPPDIDG